MLWMLQMLLNVVELFGKSPSKWPLIADGQAELKPESGKVAMKISNKSDKLIKLKKGDIIQKVEAANMAPVTVA